MDKDIQEVYEERAAILHFDGGWPKEKAEALAKAEAEKWQRGRMSVEQEAKTWAKQREWKAG